MSYKITNYTKRQAKKLGVEVKPSSVKGKKIASVGALGYMDYPNYIKKKGKKYADERRRLYKIRHKNDRNKRGTNGYYADKLLW